VHDALEYDDLRIFHADSLDVFSLGSFSDPTRRANRLRKSEVSFGVLEDNAAPHDGGFWIEGGI
jgi:hypothetical protein